MLKNIITLLYLCVYYFFESIIIGILLYIVWNNIGIKFINVELKYGDCVLIIWTYKLLRFDLLSYLNKIITIEKTSDLNNDNEINDDLNYSS